MVSVGSNRDLIEYVAQILVKANAMLRMTRNVARLLVALLGKVDSGVDKPTFSLDNRV